MEDETREWIEALVRKATLGFYDGVERDELAESVEVDYVTRAGESHTVMVFAQSHEFENERPVWAEVGDVTVDLEPEKVGESSYHVQVEVTESGDEG